MIPRELAGDDRALVIVDWSGWMRRAWAIALRSDVQNVTIKTASIVWGWLAQLLSDPIPPSLVVAVDSPKRNTFRDHATAHLDEQDRYKGGRSPPPPEYFEIEEVCRSALGMFSIPLLHPANPGDEQRWEADDSAATAVRLAREERRSVCMISADKDWLQLVSDSPTRPIVVRWKSSRDPVDTEERVILEYGVTPAQMTDYLAMTGDSGDNVKGVVGIGPKGARAILEKHGSMERALAAEPTTRLERLLHEQMEAALSARSLIELWDQAPIEWDPPAQAVGDFDVRAIERLWRGFGFTRLAESVPSFPKARWT